MTFPKYHTYNTMALQCTSDKVVNVGHHFLATISDLNRIE